MIWIRRDPRQGNSLVTFTGALDGDGARRLASAVAGLPRTPLVIDLSCATVVQDLALGLLFDGLPRACRYVIRGASHHHSWLLRCLGASVDERRHYQIRQSGSTTSSAAEQRRSGDAANR